MAAQQCTFLSRTLVLYTYIVLLLLLFLHSPLIYAIYVYSLSRMKMGIAPKIKRIRAIIYLRFSLLQHISVRLFILFTCYFIIIYTVCNMHPSLVYIYVYSI